ncbi:MULTISPECIES: WYL domain-containing protein [Novosphingobium]|uniref:WYL domain-containing protein n=2 Tax=Novosphingobium TaxID=165696 RepID=UPI001EF1118C|nr:MULTISPECIES: WYL domain-containing protein [Novosphingobium]
MQNATMTTVSPERSIIEAIALKRLIVAMYNGSEMELAPHQLFERHGDLFVSALNPRKNWRSDEERRLGHFKVDGLSNVSVTEEVFEPLPNFDGSLPRPDDKQLFAVGTD